MGFISNISTEEKSSIAFYTKTVVVTAGVEQPEAWVASLIVEGFFWTGGQSLSQISDRLKTRVDGAISIDYDSTIAALDNSSKFVVDGVDYKIVNIENVGKQNEVLQILYQEDLS